MEDNISMTKPTLFADVKLDTKPFPHFVSIPAMDEAAAEDMLAWFETKARWRLQTSHFYNQMACANLYEGFSPKLNATLGASGINFIRQRMADIFEADLDPSYVLLSAHRLTAGQGIGLHTDQPNGETETHRLVIHFSRFFEDPFGGHLIMFGSNDATDIRKIVRPLHNSAAGFALSGHSYHAVNDVTDGVRYSLIFSFWEVGKLTHQANPHASHELSTGVDAERDPLLVFLRDRGAGQIGHSSRTLTDHLAGVYEVLSRWGHDSDTRKAGLFHSVYGTPGFDKTLINRSERAIVSGVIGERSENLVWIFSLLLPRALFNGDVTQALILPLSDGSEIFVSAEDRRSLIAIFWANSLEQIPFLADEQHDSFGVLALIEYARPILKDIALEDLLSAYRSVSHA